MYKSSSQNRVVNKRRHGEVGPIIFVGNVAVDMSSHSIRDAKVTSAYISIN